MYPYPCHRLSSYCYFHIRFYGCLFSTPFILFLCGEIVLRVCVCFFLLLQSYTDRIYTNKYIIITIIIRNISLFKEFFTFQINIKLHSNATTTTTKSLRQFDVFSAQPCVICSERVSLFLSYRTSILFSFEFYFSIIILM